MLWGHDNTVVEMSIGTVAALDGGSRGGRVLWYRHCGASGRDNVEDRMSPVCEMDSIGVVTQK